KWMALPMGLTALGLAWLLWRQLGSGSQLAWPAVAVAMTLVLLTHYGAIQRGDRRSWLLIAAGLLFVGSLAGTVGEVAHAERTTGAAGSTFSPDALARARATGKPVFVYFTADWCLSCKANEAGAINREVVQNAFDKAGVVTLVGDWTNGDPVITRTLAEHGRNSVPLYLWYAPGAAKPEILPQILTPGLLTEKAQK
ncbi:thioredoxin family protein, partial [Sphingopyxis sp.]|uniref:thioredoxin family protein n=1 Tax=Sphingopyxis sp. TaxID=1908224 RepID=UPI002EDAD7A8